MGRFLAAGLAALLAVSFGSVLMSPAPEPSTLPGPMSLWEAYSRGVVSVRQVDLTYVIGGVPTTAPLGFEIANSGTVDVRIDEYAMLMSPNPRQAGGLTTQDGVLLRETVSAGGTLTYGYGDFVAQGILSHPAWWCTEERQFVRADIAVTLGGEVLPFSLEPIVETLVPSPGGTQDTLWLRLKTDPAPVVGKTVADAFWNEIPETEGQSLQVVLRATNVAIRDDDDAIVADPSAPTARVWDTIPAGFVVDLTSVTPGFRMTDNPDGSMTLAWAADLPAADVTGRAASDVPTPYISRMFSYRMTTPHLDPGRVALPRAEVSVMDDGTPEAHSAQPVLDVFQANAPPVPNAGGPYEGLEGSPVTFSAAGSTDPNGDPLTFRWDFQADGVWDTLWSSDPVAEHTYGDDVSGIVRVEVSDGTHTATAESPVVVDNGAPSVSLRVTSPATTAPFVPIGFEGSAEDPGSDDLMFAWDFGDGSPGDRTTFFNDGVGPDPSPSPEGTFPFSASVILEHTYDGPGAYVVTLAVEDDDGGVSSMQLTIQIQSPGDLKQEAIQRIKALKEQALARGDDDFLDELHEAEEHVWKSLGYKHPFHPDETTVDPAPGVTVLRAHRDRAELSLGPLPDEVLADYETLRIEWDNGVETVVDLPDEWPEEHLHFDEELWVDAWEQDLHIDAKWRENADVVVVKVHAHDASLGFSISLDDDFVASLTFSYEIRPWWVDETHLDPKKGHKVFDHEGEAADELVEEDDGQVGCDELDEEMWSDAERAVLDAECDAIANLLVQADEMLALVALEDARNTPVDDPDREKKVRHEIEKAEENMAEAYAEWGELEYEDAIHHFRKAWKHAQHAMKHARK